MKLPIEVEVGPRTKRTLAMVAAAAVLLGAAAARAQPATVPVERVDRATVASTGMILSQNGAWLSRVDQPIVGTMVLLFARGAFTAPPTCVWSVPGTERVGPSGISTAVQSPPVTCLAATTTSITCQSKGQYDLPLSMICVGPS